MEENLTQGPTILHQSSESGCQDHILTTLDIGTLRNVIRREILPLLGVSQFAMIRLTEDKLPFPLMLCGVLPEDLPTRRRMQSFLDDTIQPIPPEVIPDRLTWIKQVVPLKFENKLLALGLLGERSGGQEYSPEVLAKINCYANQISLALVNINHANNLRTLYLTELEHREMDHRGMAARLQSEVLNPLAMLKDTFDPSDAPPLFVKIYQEAMQNIREQINLLYPAMQQYSLYSGLVSLVESFNSLRMEEMRVFLDIPDTDINYDSEVETNLFRIIQQACQNAIQHSRASAIHISGVLEPQLAEITVSDDGVGFSAPEEMELMLLLSYHHFGLASMMERAELIGATFKVYSQPNQGCRVSVSWRPQPDCCTGDNEV
jgi:signal transduction histidine kinase